MDVGDFDLEWVAQKVCLRFVDHGLRQIEYPLHGHRAEGAGHKQGAVRKVNNAEGAENESEAERNQRIGRALIEPVENLKDDCVHWSRPDIGMAGSESSRKQPLFEMDRSRRATGPFC